MLLEYFRQIAAIPRISGHEDEVKNLLTRLARENGLSVRTDRAGNLLIVRPPAAGYGKSPSIILQAHLDMVPEKAEGLEFDFLKQGITPVEKDGFLVSSLPTTLGADNGIGAAAALELLLDKDFQCGELRGLFTVCEESGLGGASGIEPFMLEGDILLNLDSEEDGVFIIGCAGGMNTRITLPVVREEAPAGADSLTLEIKDLPGGHSGIDIDKNIPNAIIEGLKKIDFAISSVSGGGRGSAIPRSFSAAGVTLSNPAPAASEAAAAGKTIKVWEKNFQKKIIELLLSIPNGALEFEHNSVKLSSNFGAVSCPEGGRLELLFNQRGFDDRQRRELGEFIAEKFIPFGAEISHDSEYCAWRADFSSPLAKEAAELYKSMFNIVPRIEAIHAGLECGFFAAIRPDLPMLSFGPEIKGAHSPGEKLSLESLERFRKFLRRLVIRLNRLPENTGKEI